MRVPSRIIPTLVAAVLAVAGTSAARASNFKYWSWAPGCDAQDMGTTTACWSDAEATSSTPGLTPATRPDAGSWVYVLQQSPSIRPLTFSSGTMAIERMLLVGADAPAQLNVAGGELLLSEHLFLASVVPSTILGSARIVQTAGTVSALGIHIGTANDIASSYGISGGRVTAAVAHVGFVFANAFRSQASKGTLLVDGTAFADLADLSVSALGTLDVRGGELHASRLTIEQAGSTSFTGGLIEIAGTGSVWSGGAFAYGSGFGLGTPTLRLATGAALSVGARLDVGQLGRGVLQLGAGARLDTGDAALGKGFFLGRGDGLASVDGPGAQWSVNGILDVGVTGTGDLKVLRGGRVVGQHGYLGRTEDPNPANGRNAALVGGAGSLWRSEGTLTIGGGDAAPGQASDVSVVEGGRLEAGGTLRMWGGSTLQVGIAGTAAARTLVTGAGSVVSLRGGRLITTEGAQVAGTLRVLDGDASIVDGPVALSRTGRLEMNRAEARFSGPLSTAGGSQITLRDSTLVASSGLQVNGDLRVEAGTESHVHGAVTFTTLDDFGSGRLDVAGSQVHFWGPLTFEAATYLHNDGELIVHDRLVLNLDSGLTGSGAKYIYGHMVLGAGDIWFQDPGALALMPGSVLEMDIGGRTNEYDRYETRSWMLLGGTLKLATHGGYHGQAGDRFTLLVGHLEGSFDGVDTSAFALAPGLAWDFSQLNSAGVVGIVAVPEPGTWALMLAGLAVVGRLSRQRARS